MKMRPRAHYLISIQAGASPNTMLARVLGQVPREPSSGQGWLFFMSLIQSSFLEPTPSLRHFVTTTERKTSPPS